MESADMLIQYITQLESEIINLGNSINRANVDWKDANFNKLSSEIKNIANASQEIMRVGENCKKQIKDFKTILNS